MDDDDEMTSSAEINDTVTSSSIGKSSTVTSSTSDKCDVTIECRNDDVTSSCSSSGCVADDAITDSDDVIIDSGEITTSSSNDEVAKPKLKV